MLASLLAGLGGAAASGLNAYLPLLIIALADRMTGAIDLGEPYDFISSAWGIVILLVLLPIELVADKIPGVDHASDLLHSALRPAAAAFVMMALTDERGSFNAVVALILGLLVGIAVHGYKATTRPSITLATKGIGNPIISMVEDVLAVIIIVTALVYPYAIIAIVPLCLFALHRSYERMKSGQSRFTRIFRTA